MERKVIKTKKYTIEVIEYDDDTFGMHRVNDGFLAMELLGHIAMIQSEIITMIKKGVPKMNEIKRSIVVDEESKPTK